MKKEIAPSGKLRVGLNYQNFLLVNGDSAGQAIVAAIAGMARALGLAVAAEGVENAAQLERLVALGCADWQGHYFSAPLDAAAFEKLMEPALKASGSD